MTTTTKRSVHEALSAVMADVQAVSKSSRNNEQGYIFRGIDAVVNAVGPKLREHGVLVIPQLEESTWRDVRTSRDKPARECTVRVRYRFYGPAGDWIECVVPGESMDFGDKGAAKAMSVAFRIALLQALCIPTDEPDADSQSYERSHDEQAWDAAKPATDVQAKEFDQYLARIKLAPTDADIKSTGQLIKDARGNNRITRAQYDQLDIAAGARLAELRQETPA